MLIGFLVLERLPWWLALIVLACLEGLVIVLWRGPSGVMITGLHLCIVVLDWLNLAMLPRLNRSFGPVKPPLLSLTLLRFCLTLFTGLLDHWGREALIVAAVVQISLLVVAFYSLWIEPFQLGVTYQTLCSPKLDPQLPPVRILHVGDLHIERLTYRERRLQSLIDVLAPDMIVFSGDFVSLSFQDDPETVAAVTQVVRRWQAPYGVFVVSGSPLVETQDMVARYIECTEVRWLRDEVIGVDVNGQQLALIGITCKHNWEDDAARMRQVTEQVPDDRFKMLLFHAPDIAPQASQAKVDLYVCGHTHGGQLRLPLFGALITSSRLGKRYEMGRYDVNEMTLYVSRGVGLEGAGAPRARFLCSPEVVLWTLSGR